MGTVAPKPSVHCRQILKPWGSSSPPTCSLSVHVQSQEASLWASLPSPYPGLWDALQSGARESSWGHLCVCLESWPDCRSGWAGVENLCHVILPFPRPWGPSSEASPVPVLLFRAGLARPVCRVHVCIMTPLRTRGNGVWTELISITIASVLKLWRACCRVLHIYVSNTEFNTCTEYIASQVVQWVKNPPAMQGDTGDAGSIPGLGNLLEESMATHSSIFTWRIPWTEESGGLTAHGIAKSWTWLKRLSTHRIYMGVRCPMLKSPNGENASCPWSFVVCCLMQWSEGT